MNKIKEKIVNEASQDTGFLNVIAQTPEGKRIRSCLQCGTCSATCPLSGLLEHSPRQIFAMIRAGMKDAVMTSSTPWLCASCYKCLVDCPAQIKITEVMYKLKRMSLAENYASKDGDIKRFYFNFVKLVCKYGRSYEMGLMIKYMMLRHPVNLLKQVPLGFRLLKSGALPLLPHKVKNIKKFRKMVNRAISIKEE